MKFKHLIFWLFILLGLATFAGQIFAATQDFTSYTEVDPDSMITVTADSVTSNFTGDTNAYVYKDFGADYFNNTTDFEYLFKISSASDALFSHILFSDALGSINQLEGATEPHLSIYTWGGLDYISLHEYTGANHYESTYAISPPYTFYATLDYDSTIGSYGRLTLDLYSDEERLTLVDTETLDPHVAFSFKYLMPMSSYSGISGAGDNVTADLDLQTAEEEPGIEHNYSFLLALALLGVFVILLIDLLRRILI